LPSSDEPHDDPSGATPDEPSGQTPGAAGGTPRVEPEPGAPSGAPEQDDDAHTSIIRRHPSGPIPEPAGDDTRTSILRRQLTGDEPTNLVGPLEEPETGLIRTTRRRRAGTLKPPSGATAVAASAVSIVSGWATAVVATDLITGWWRTDRLFCVGVGFLTAVFAASTIAGVVGLLLRRRVGIFLTLVASVLALLIFAGIFVAGAHMAGAVRAIPVLPLATAVFTLVPPTWRWTS
jgi:hypothetical protein